MVLWQFDQITVELSAWMSNYMHPLNVIVYPCIDAIVFSLIFASKNDLDQYWSIVCWYMIIAMKIDWLTCCFHSGERWSKQYPSSVHERKWLCSKDIFLLVFPILMLSTWCQWCIENIATWPAQRLNLKMSSYQDRDPHVKDKTVSWPSYL